MRRRTTWVCGVVFTILILFSLKSYFRNKIYESSDIHRIILREDAPHTLRLSRERPKDSRADGSVLPRQTPPILARIRRPPTQAHKRQPPIQARLRHPLTQARKRRPPIQARIRRPPTQARIRRPPKWDAKRGYFIFCLCSGKEHFIHAHVSNYFNYSLFQTFRQSTFCDSFYEFFFFFLITIRKLKTSSRRV